MMAPSFGALLKQYRMKAGISQEMLAERANISTRAISDLERGINRAPRSDTLDALLQALRLSEEQREALIASARSSIPIVSPPPDPLYMLPAPPTELIGRERELSRAIEIFRRNRARLLTLTGLAGVGKTHLALDIAHHLRNDFKDGLVFVPLASITDPSLVAPQMARALKLRETAPAQATEQVCTFLAEKHLLLVLDNFEQIIDAASFVAEIIQSCPHMRVLVTSRIPLRLRSEQEFPITPLATESAVALFIQRAQAIRPDFQSNVPLIEAICQRLDGLPLAIELAAAQVKVLSLPLMLERLNTRFKLLRSGARDLPERQRTLRNAVTWSYELLPPAQRRCLRALGVFAGGWTLDAAEAVCHLEGLLARDDVLLALSALIDHSLVPPESSIDGISRFTMLETIREYALECLQAVGEEQQTRQQHARYYAERAHALTLLKIGEVVHDAELTQEFANVHAALQWTFEQHEAAIGLQLAAYFGRIWTILGQMREGYTWLEKMLELDKQAGEAAATLSVRMAALSSAGVFARNLGHTDRAKAFAEEELQLAEQLGDHAGISNALTKLGVLAQSRADLEGAARSFEQSYQHALKTQDAGTLGRIRINIASIARAQGNLARARAILEEQLEIERTVRMTWGIANLSTLLGHIARDQGQHELARTRYQESLPLYRSFGNLTYTAWCIEGVAVLANSEGKYKQATRFCAFAAGLRQKAQTPLPPDEQATFDKLLDTLQGALGRMSFTITWEEGTVLSDEEGIEMALSWVSKT